MIDGPLLQKTMGSNGKDVASSMGRSIGNKFAVAFKAGCVTITSDSILDLTFEVCGCKETTATLEVNGWDLKADSQTYTYQEIYGMQRVQGDSTEYFNGSGMLTKWEILSF